MGGETYADGEPAAALTGAEPLVPGLASVLLDAVAQRVAGA